MKIATFLILVLVLTLSAMGCGKTQKKEESTTAKTRSSEALKRIGVTALEFGDKWPFENIPTGYVLCDGTAAIFEADGKRYALNGVAKSRFNYPFPYEAGIIKRIPLNPSEPSLGMVNADTEILRKLCD